MKKLIDLLIYEYSSFYRVIILGLMHDDLFHHRHDVRKGSNDSRFRPARNISCRKKKTRERAIAFHFIIMRYRKIEIYGRGAMCTYNL